MFSFNFSKIIGESSIMKNAISKANVLKNSKSNILLYGESGTGKDLFARSIHYESKRSDRPFLPINCSAVPESLIESILFGYIKGAFTGADKEGKAGLFESAEGGTVFLDEIADMPLMMQAKLLRVLETKTIQRIGDTKYIEVDFRLICATNRELHVMVEENTFRKDLLYRLNTAPIKIPSLKERKEDLPILIDFFIKKFKNINNNDVTEISSDTKELLLKYPWSGNVRELENVIEYACNFCNDGVIKIEDLPLRFTSNHRDDIYPKKNANNSIIVPLDVLEKEEIIKALSIHGLETYGISKAAYDLNISPSTLYRKIKKYSIEFK